MRGLIVFVLIAATAWSGWWMIGSSAQEKALAAWLDNRRDAGWTADVGDFSVHGFPNRFDTRLSNIELGTKDWAWSGPDFTLFALSYKPNHIIVSWPDTHTVYTPETAIDLSNDLLRASLIFKPENALPLGELRLEGVNLRLSSPDWSAELAAINAALYDFADVVNGYQLFAKATDITVPQHWQDIAQIDTPIAEVRLKTILTLDGEINRHLADVGTPNLTDIQIEDFGLDWGEISLTADGDLSVSDRGLLEGTLTFRTQNWRAIFTLLKVTNVIRPQDYRKWESGLTLASALQGGTSLEATFTINNGMIRLGPVPLGPAPVVPRF